MCGLKSTLQIIAEIDCILSRALYRCKFYSVQCAFATCALSTLHLQFTARGNYSRAEGVPSTHPNTHLHRWYTAKRLYSAAPKKCPNELDNNALPRYVSICGALFVLWLSEVFQSFWSCQSSVRLIPSMTYHDLTWPSTTYPDFQLPSMTLFDIIWLSIP